MIANIYQMAIDRIPNDITATIHSSRRMVYSTVLPTGETIHFIISVSYYANSTVAILSDSAGIQLEISGVPDQLYSHICRHYTDTILSIDRRIFIYSDDHTSASRALWCLSIYSPYSPDDGANLIQRMVEAPAGSTCESLFSEEMCDYIKYLSVSRPMPSYKVAQVDPTDSSPTITTNSSPTITTN